MTREALVELRGKYERILAMRLAHASGDEDPLAVPGQMSDLAARFPGALRELDALPLDAIRRRLDALEGVLASQGPADPWMEAIALFHALMRGALVAKRWLAGRKVVQASTAADFEAALATLPFSADAGAWVADLARVASPPRGRVADAVLERLAQTLQLTVGEARRLTFGGPRDR